jgi:hypothetical protein
LFVSKCDEEVARRRDNLSRSPFVEALRWQKKGLD